MIMNNIALPDSLMAKLQVTADLLEIPVADVVVSIIDMYYSKKRRLDVNSIRY